MFREPALFSGGPYHQKTFGKTIDYSASLKTSSRTFITRDAKIGSTSSSKVSIFLHIWHRYARWTLETAIGNLGDEIRQDKDPYTNILVRGVLRAQLNSILAMLPNLKLKKDDGLPLGAKDLGNGYALLRACEDTAKPVTEADAAAIMIYWGQMDWPNRDRWPRAVMRWSRLRLPNGQTARISWIESRSRRPLRRTSCVKVVQNYCFNYGLLLIMLIIVVNYQRKNSIRSDQVLLPPEI